MKIKRKDLELLMQYLEREKPEMVDLEFDENSLNSSVKFSFRDLEARECTVRIFNGTLNSSPDLIKTMKLYSRVPKTEPSSGSDS